MSLAPLSATGLVFNPKLGGHVSSGFQNPDFGKYMLTIPYTKKAGWGTPVIGPRAALAIDPLAGVMQ